MACLHFCIPVVGMLHTQTKCHDCGLLSTYCSNLPLRQPPRGCLLVPYCYIRHSLAIFHVVPESLIQLPTYEQPCEEVHTRSPQPQPSDGILIRKWTITDDHSLLRESMQSHPVKPCLASHPQNFNLHGHLLIHHPQLMCASHFKSLPLAFHRKVR